ncbi:MAG: GTPase [Actinomycetota bacterium]
MTQLLAALEEVGPFDNLVCESARRRAVDKIRLYMLPRLADPGLPLIVALIGSTGVGKSTILNSLAGRVVSSPGPLRPTTDKVHVWAGDRRPALDSLGDVIVGDHPLLDSIALVDTPDLDSDLVDHRRLALEAAEAADAIIFVTSASRYGDAMAWETIREFPGRVPMVVVINRVPSRASGARSGLISRLRQHGFGTVTVLSLSEQRIDPAGERLSPQSVQKIGAQLRAWASEALRLRLEVLEHATDQLVSDLDLSLGEAGRRRAEAIQLRIAVESRYRRAAEELAAMRPPTARLWSWWKKGRSNEALVSRMVAIVDRAAAEAAALITAAGRPVESSLMRADPETVNAFHSERHDEVISRLVMIDSERLTGAVNLDSGEGLATIERGRDLLIDLRWDDA